MTVFIINIAENLQTNRSQRNRSVFDTLKSQETPVRIISSDFEHGTRTRITAKHDDEMLIRVLKYSHNFAFSRLFNHIYFSFCVFFILIFRKDVNAILVSSIPCELLFSISLLKRIRKHINIVVDVRDIWPDSLPPQTRPLLLVKIFKLYSNTLNGFAFRRLDHVIYTNPDFVRFLSRYGVIGSFVPLGFDKARFDSVGDGNRPVPNGLVYIGNLNASFNLSVLEGFVLANQGPLTIIGKGDLEIEYRVKFPKAMFPGYLKYHDVPSELVKYRYGLLPITGSATLPNKLYDYAACGLDIITNSFEAARMWSVKEPELIMQNVYLVRNFDIRREYLQDYGVTAHSICEKLHG